MKYINNKLSYNQVKLNQGILKSQRKYFAEKSNIKK